MNLTRPHAAVVPSLEGDVLVTLANSEAPLNGREVARLVRGASQGGVNRALKRLVVHGLVVGKQAGAAIFYALNREHLAFPAVERLATLREELLLRLKRELSKWRPAPLHASMFGSAARGDGDVSSDIDLLIVRRPKVALPAWQAQVDRLADHVQRWTGNELSVADVTLPEIRALKGRKPALADSLRRHSITLWGEDVSELLGGHA